MEYEKVFATIAIVAVSVLAVFAMINHYNTAYGTSVGDSFNNTLQSVNVISNLTKYTIDASDATQDIEGSGTTDPQSNLISRSLRIITILPRLLGLVPDILYEGAIVLGVPEEYTTIAVAVFVFSFTLLLAYLLLIGVKRLL
jgi:hypothetical protein